MPRSVKSMTELNTAYNNELRIAGIVEESIVDGPGIRFTVFTQGCPHNCVGCHNPQTHDFNGGRLTSIDEIFAQFKKNSLLSGATFSGGEPFCQAAVLYELGKRIKSLNKNIMVYSGYTYEQLKELSNEDTGIKNLLSISDILIDGRFEEAERDLSLLYRGSRNQRIIKLKNGEIAEIYPSDIEHLDIRVES